jgi:hypothetical protein
MWSFFVSPTTRREENTMKKLSIIGAVAMACLAAPAFAQSEPDMVCLITWGSVEDADDAANATALSGEYLSAEKAAEEAAESDGFARVFDYSGREDLNISNNEEEEAFCEGPTFNPDDGGNQGEDNSAKKFAPGQEKEEGESAREKAPGHEKEEGESAKESAPGQQKKADDDGDSGNESAPGQAKKQ